MKLFTLGRTEVRMHLGLLFVVIAACVLGKLYELLMALLALILHESAHAIAAYCTMCEVKTLTLYPFGAEARIDTTFNSNKSIACIAEAGPVCSFVVAGLCMLIMRFFPVTITGLEAFCNYNLILGLINLLPAYPLDGGRLLRCLLCIRVRGRTATAIVAWLGVGIGSAILALAIYATLFLSPPLMLYMMGGFLVIAAAKELITQPEIQLQSALQRSAIVQGGETVSIKYSVAHKEMRALEVLRSMKSRDYAVIRIVDDSMQTIGEVDEGMIIRGIGRLGAYSSIEEIYRAKI